MPVCRWFTIWTAVQGVKDVAVQPSVSLQHLPYDKEADKQLPGSVHARLSFALQKLAEMVQIAKKAPQLSTKVALADTLPAVGTFVPGAGSVWHMSPVVGRSICGRYAWQHVV